MKVSIEQIEQTLLEKKIEPPKVAEIIKDLMQAIEEEKADRQANAEKKQKWESVIFINDPDGKIKGDFTGWVVKQQTGTSTSLLLGKLQNAAKTQNESSKRKKTLIKNMGELFQALKPKFLKEKGIKIQTKEAVQVISINGKTL